MEWFPGEHNEPSLQAMGSLKSFESIKQRLIQCSGNTVDGFVLGLRAVCLFTLAGSFLQLDAKEKG